MAGASDGEALQVDKRECVKEARERTHDAHTKRMQDPPLCVALTLVCARRRDYEALREVCLRARETCMKQHASPHLRVALALAQRSQDCEVLREAC